MAHSASGPQTKSSRSNRADSKPVDTVCRVPDRHRIVDSTPWPDAGRRQGPTSMHIRRSGVREVRRATVISVSPTGNRLFITRNWNSDGFVSSRRRSTPLLRRIRGNTLYGVSPKRMFDASLPRRDASRPRHREVSVQLLFAYQQHLTGRGNQHPGLVDAGCARSANAYRGLNRVSKRLRATLEPHSVQATARISPVLRPKNCTFR